MLQIIHGMTSIRAEKADGLLIVTMSRGKAKVPAVSGKIHQFVVELNAAGAA